MTKKEHCVYSAVSLTMMRYLPLRSKDNPRVQSTVTVCTMERTVSTVRLQLVLVRSRS